MKAKLHIFYLLIILATTVCSQERKVYIKEFEEFNLVPIIANNQTFYAIDLGKDFRNSNSVAQAQLPLENSLVTYELDSDIQVNVTVLEKDTIKIKDDILIYPIQKSKIKIDTTYSFAIDKKYYTTDAFQGENLVKVDKIGVMRNKNIAVVSISPLRYNPVKNLIERVKKLQVEIVSVKDTSLAKAHKKNLSAAVPKTNANSPLKFAIVTDEAFKENLTPFVKWKTMQGFEVLELYTSQIGSDTTQIRSYLKNLYTSSTPLNTPIDYLLIVGDTNIVPTFKGKYRIENYPAHYTDLYYAEYTGDILPDAFYGRISVSDTQTLNAVIDKTIKYEQYLLEDTSYLNSSLLVAGKEGSDNAPTMTNGQNNYLKNYFQSLTDTNIYYNPTSADNSNKPLIYENLSSGNSFVSYTGHGSFMGWQNPPYRVKDVDTLLNNVGKYGIFINNCCHTGQYDMPVCFTESLLQAKDKGGVACIGSSDYTLWDEDYYWAVGYKDISLNPQYDATKLGMYDRLFHTHNEIFSQHYITSAQMVQSGDLAVTQSLSPYYKHYWEMYNLQGDPTLMPYIGIPKTFERNFPDTLIGGKKNLSFTTIPHTYVALSDDNGLIASVQADSLGNVNIDLADITEAKTVKIVLTNQFYRPLIDSIVFTSPKNALVVLKNIKIKDKTTNQEVENLLQGEQYTGDIDVTNVGLADLNGENNYIKIITDTVLLMLNTNSSVLNTNLPITHINSLETLHFSDAFEFTVKGGVKNFSLADIIFEIHQNNEKTNEKEIIKEVFAPQLYINSASMSRNGSTISLKVLLKNTGRQQSSQGSIEIGNLSSNISVNDFINPIKTLGVNEKDTANFQIILTDTAQSEISFDLNYTAGDYNAYKSFNIDLKPKIESFENGFATLDWQNDETNAWVIDSTTSFSGKYSARSKVNLAHNKRSRLNLNVNNAVSSTISFYAMVSSEKDYDKLVVYLDNEPMFDLSFGYNDLGLLEGWKQYSFPISDGSHTVSFSYEKDQSNSYGEDCARIDNVVLSVCSDSVVFGLDDLMQSNIAMFPNPAAKTINLNNLPQKSTVTIIDNNARTVYYDDNIGESKQIDISFLENGVYYVVITNRNIVLDRRKLIVAK